MRAASGGPACAITLRVVRRPESASTFTVIWPCRLRPASVLTASTGIRTGRISEPANGAPESDTTSSALAPERCACWAFSVNVQTPRSATAISPLVKPGAELQASPMRCTLPVARPEPEYVSVRKSRPLRRPVMRAGERSRNSGTLNVCCSTR
jgi:hypothetical protein